MKNSKGEGEWGGGEGGRGGGAYRGVGGWWGMSEGSQKDRAELYGCIK